MTYRPRVLVVCAHAAGASRLCAAYREHLAGDRYESLAAALGPKAGVSLGGYGRPEERTRWLRRPEGAVGV